mgnify:CR=1 FL=1
MEKGSGTVPRPAPSAVDTVRHRPEENKKAVPVIAPGRAGRGCFGSVP